MEELAQSLASPVSEVLERVVADDGGRELGDLLLLPVADDPRQGGPDRSSDAARHVRVGLLKAREALLLQV